MAIVLVPYLILLLTANIICFSRWQMLSRADRVLSSLLAAAFLYESSSFVCVQIYGKNAFLSHFYSPLEFLLISLYFNYSLRTFRGWAGIVTGLLGVVFSIINTVVWEPLSGSNFQFLLFESAAVIMYCLVAFHQVLKTESLSPYRFAMFWIATCFVLFWGATFMSWGMAPYIHAREGLLQVLHNYVLAFAAYLLYIGLALIFWRYKSLIPSGYHAR